MQTRHPCSELMPVVRAALADGVLTEEECEDILWLCQQLTSTGYCDQVTADLQRLHALLGAILADGVVTEAELQGAAYRVAHSFIESEKITYHFY